MAVLRGGLKLLFLNVRAAKPAHVEASDWALLVFVISPLDDFRENLRTEPRAC